MARDPDDVSPEIVLTRTRAKIQETLIDMLSHASTKQQNMVFQRALGRFDPRLWPFAVDLPQWMLDLENVNPYFAVTIKMIRDREGSS